MAGPAVLADGRQPAVAGPAILADDLTGALEAGARLAAQGSSTVEVLLPPWEPRGADAVVLDTESRGLGARAAARRVRAALACLGRTARPLLYKKIDSTLRGKVAAELEALLAARPEAIAVVAPALPSQGRTTRGGIHYVRGVPLAETEYAPRERPASPESRVADVVRSRSFPVSVEIGLQVLRSGPPRVLHELARAWQAGRRIAVFDAETEKDLELIARILATSKGRSFTVVPCGSAGLLGQMARIGLFGGHGARETALHRKPARHRSGASHRSRSSPRDTASALSPGSPVLIVSASPATATHRQLELLSRARRDVDFVIVDLAALAFPVIGQRREAARVLAAVRASLDQGRHAALQAAPIPRGSIADDDAGLSRAILALTARVVRNACRLARPRALLLVGGDTAHRVIRGLGCRALRVQCEISPGVPFSRLLGGVCDGMPIASKAGGFGADECLAEVLEKLSPRGSRL